MIEVSAVVMATLSSRMLFSGADECSPDGICRSRQFLYKRGPKASWPLLLESQLVTRGTTGGHKEQRFLCNSLWEDCSPDLFLVIRFPNLDIFRFEILQVIHKFRRFYGTEAFVLRYITVKGTVLREFWLLVFSWISFPQAPEDTITAISNF